MTTNLLFFQKLDKYNKINQPWIFEPFNVPNKKTGAQIVRFSSGEGIKCVDGNSDGNRSR